MKRSTMLLGFLAAAVLSATTPVHAAPLSSAFTYQGRVDRNNTPISDTFSMIFKLYDAASGGTQIGGTLTLNGIVATNGQFSVSLDFGATPFTGQARWLDVQVKGAADASFTALSRQSITATPYALFALSAGSTGGGPWAADGFGNITYSGGAAGVTGQSSHAATGVGVFFDGGNVNGASVYGYNYGTGQPIPLFLNAPGSFVIVGSVTTPAAKLDVGTTGLGIRSQTTGSSAVTNSAAVTAIGKTNVTTGATAVGVYATSDNGIGVMGISNSNDGVYGASSGSGRSGVTGLSGSAGGQGGYFRNDGGGTALFADGLAKVKTLQILGGADVAERFESDDRAEPGTVMEIDPTAAGHVRVAGHAYSRTVAGVISGANGLSAGVELAKDEQRAGTVALALTGRVWVNCDATHTPIHAGDLLTTSSRAGHAMAAVDRDRAQGAIVGKAMTSLEHGTGLVLVLVSLQ